MVEEGGKEETALGGCRGQGTRSQGAELDRSCGSWPRLAFPSCAESEELSEQGRSVCGT